MMVSKIKILVNIRSMYQSTITLLGSEIIGSSAASAILLNPIITRIKFTNIGFTFKEWHATRIEFVFEKIKNEESS